MAKKKSKWKKIAKNVGKAAVLAGALYGASKLGKRKGGEEGDIGIGLSSPHIGDVGSERKNIYKAVEILKNEFEPISDARSDKEFRRIAAGNLLTKFWSETNE